MTFESIPYIESQNIDFIQFPRPPFPPTFITVSDFINKRESSSRIFRKSPNAFFIYRKAFTNNLTSLNYKLTMIDVSKLVSNFWKNESKEVKDAYAEIAKKIDVELKEKRKHDKKCPVIWKIDKKSKKQKRGSRRNLNSNDLTNNSSTKFRNTTEIAFESIPVNEPSQRILRSPEETNSQPSLGNSPISSSPLMSFPGVVHHQGYNIMNYDNSYECQSNESEEETYDLYTNLNIYDQNLNQIYHSSGYSNNIVNYDNLFVPFNLNMNDPYVNNSENLASHQGNEFP